MAGAAGRTRLAAIAASAALLAAGLLSAGFADPAATALVADPAAAVNPFIGTANDGNDFPGADAPFGMVQWSPDTVSRPDGGGYAYGDSAISGFSLTHLSGPGCRAAGDIPVLPTVGAVDTAAADSFSHTREAASAGYYRVALDNGVSVQLTTTTRTGMASFRFPATARANLILKLAAASGPTRRPASPSSAPPRSRARPPRATSAGPGRATRSTSTCSSASRSRPAPATPRPAARGAPGRAPPR